MEEAGGEVEDGRVVLARNVAAEGRSRAWVGGAAVPVSALAERRRAAGRRPRSVRPAPAARAGAQRDALDRFGGAGRAKARRRTPRSTPELVDVERELREVVRRAQERAREADLLRFGLAEIEAVDPQPGEDATLAAEEGRLGFADTLRTAAEQAREAL